MLDDIDSDGFVHVRCHSEYSIGWSIATIDGLTKRAAELGMVALALTDTGSMAGIPEFEQSCHHVGIKPIHGSEVFFYHNGTMDTLILLAGNEQGYRNIVGLYDGNQVAGPVGRSLVDLAALLASPSGIICIAYTTPNGQIVIEIHGLKELEHIQHTVDILASRGQVVDFGMKTFDDPETIAVFASVDTEGVPYFEDAGIRDCLRSFRASCFGDIVLINALYNPGYTEVLDEIVEARKQDRTAGSAPERLEPIMRESYGELVYQEQVIQALHEIYGMTPAEADIARRTFGKKRVDHIAALEKKCRKYAAASGISSSEHAHIFNHLAKHAGRTWNKAHFTGRAVIAWQSAYLKPHHRELFMDAMVKSDESN